MSGVQHFISISGGKDSTATACLAIERMQRRPMGNLPPRFLFADTGNEHPITLEHVAYLGEALGIEIETVRADFAHMFAARRIAIARDWPHELRRKQHSKACLSKQRKDLKYAEKAALREKCDCPIKISPPVPQHLIDRAVSLMKPSGNQFLDMGMLHGRFPGSQTRFCTGELKLAPMDAVKDIVRMEGVATVEWIGERAAESKERAEKPTIELLRCSFRAPTVLYRPIHAWDVRQVFEIAKRHGLKPNPLYLMGMGRVGCMPCIMCKKGELQEIARRFPEQIERIAEWEATVGDVARHANTAVAKGEREDFISSFLPTDKVPRDKNGKIAARIDLAVEWSRTTRGGRNYDMLAVIDDILDAEQPNHCKSSYGLCE
ncbi:MAG: phosphoadenosine phosphosulfate reductase family protein [Pseudomonadota bacterium]